MRKTALLTAMLATIAMYACTAPAPMSMPMQGTAEDEAALRGLAGKYSASFNTGDAAALAMMVSEDFENISADGAHTQGRAAFQQMEDMGVKDRAAAGMNLTLATTTGYLNWIDATHAVIGGTFMMSGLPPGAPDKGAWIVVCEKAADGQWLMTNSLVAEMPPAPPAPPAPMGGEGS
jgi:ketosteroid isomerase-like protein